MQAATSADQANDEFIFDFLQLLDAATGVAFPEEEDTATTKADALRALRESVSTITEKLGQVAADVGHVSH